MNSINKNVIQADKVKLVPSDPANLKSKQIHARTAADDVLSKEEVVAEENIAETNEADFVAPHTTENTVDRPVLLAQLDQVVESEESNDKGLLLFEDSSPVGFGEASSVSTGAAAGAANNGISWLPVVGALGAVGVLASHNNGSTSADGSGGGGGGGGGGSVSVSVSVDSVTITSATNAQNHTLNAGDVVTVTVDMSEVVLVSGTPQLQLTIGGAVVQANYLGGSGTNQLSFTYTIQAGQTDVNGIAIAANALQLNGGTIQDAAGHDAVLTHVAVADNANYLVDTASPAVNQVAITSATGAQNNTLTGGDVLTVTVDMSEVVQVSGTPQLALTIGGAVVQANYLGGSGTNQLSFSYTIQANQMDANGVAIAANALQLNGGTIQDAAGNNAVLTHSAVADNANYMVDTASPGVIQVAITSASNAQNHTLNAGDVVTVTVDMSEVVQVSGSPQLALTIGGAVVQANYASGSGTNQLSFTYTIQAGQTDANGIAIAANALQFNGGTIQDVAGNNAVLTHLAVADSANYLVDTASPAVNQVAITSATGAQNNTLTVGDVVTVTVDMTEVVQVSGTPQLALTIGGAVVQANYLAGSGTNQLSFTYTIQAGQTDANGIAIATNALQLNGGTIQDAAGNNAVLTHAAVADNANYLVDTASPGVSQMLIDVETGEGDIVHVTVNFTEAVSVSGTPQLAVKLGDVIVQATYDAQATALSGSGSSLVFSYLITGGQTYHNGIEIAANSLQLNGGSISDAAGNNAVLTHAAPISTWIDDGVPSVTQVAITSATGAQNSTLNAGDVVTVTVNMSEVVQVSGSPQLALTIGGAVVQANYASGSGTNQLSFTYTIQAGQTDANGIAIAANALQLNGGTIHDAVGNNATNTSLMHLAVADNSSYKVDTTAPSIFTTALTLTGDTFASVESNELGTAYLVRNDVIVTSLADITTASDTLWNSGPISAANTGTFLATTGLSDGTYKVYAVDAAGNLAQALNSVTIVSSAITASPVQLSAIAGGTGGFVINGQAASDWSGLSVSGAGDVNGDGLADLIISADNADPGGRIDAGKTYVVFGKGTGTAVNLSAVEAGTGGFVINGSLAGDWSAYSVSGAGDVNGDGLADLIVGAIDADPGGRTDAGKTYVVFGKSTGTAINLSAVEAGTGGFVINGQAAFDTLGYSVSGAGDVNGDGLADVIVSAINADPHGVSNAGKSYVVFGKSTGTAINLSAVEAGTGGFVINGQAVDDTLGYSVSGAGDVNGDGLADLIVGAVDATSGGVSNAGKSYVVFGKSTGTAIDVIDLGNGARAGFAINGLSTNDFSGYSVSGAGDINGDGLADLIVGATGADPGGRTDAGKSYVVFGKSTDTAINLSDIENGAGGFVINGQTAGDTSGISVSGAGDVNGDGLADLIVGASNASGGVGKSYVIFGSTTGAFNQTAVDALGTTGDDNLSDGGVQRTLVGDAGNDNFTATAASVLIGGTGNDSFTIGSEMIRALESPYGGGGNLDRLARVDGGAGVDTLRLTGGDLMLNLTQIASQGASFGEVGSRLSSIEKIDLTGSGNNTLKLSVGDVLDLSGVNDLFGLFGSATFAGRHELAVRGNAGDEVVIADKTNWGFVGNYFLENMGYAVYNHNSSGATLFVDMAVTVL